jgi:cytochrome c biogenesis protein CcmG, thiol:disulfide interchange protein DsbE
MRSLASTQEIRKPRWRRLVAFFLPASAFLALLAFGVLRADGPPQPGDQAPPFSAPSLADSGSSVSLSDYSGRPLVVNFWASWCLPCKDEAPLLERAHRAYGGEIAFLGVDVRDSRSEALAFVRRHGIGYPSVRDETRVISERYGLLGQPETFFIDQNGVIVEHYKGPLDDPDHLFALLDLLVSRNA